MIITIAVITLHANHLCTTVAIVFKCIDGSLNSIVIIEGVVACIVYVSEAI